MVLGDDGIIQNAQAAKQATENTEKEDAKAIGQAAAVLDYYAKKSMAESELDEIFTFTEANPYKGNVAKIVDGNVPIPVGFSHIEGETKDDGIVIIDGNGNEFVWVPVDEVVNSESEKTDSEKVYLVNNSRDGGDYPNDGKGTTSNKQQEYVNMKNSVELYGGFYVGRYETSLDEEGRAASVPGADQIGIYWFASYSRQKELYNSSDDSVASGMIYGSQWDAIMDWMKDVVNPTNNQLYINNALGMGNYSYEYFPNGEDYPPEPVYVTLIKTGTNPNYMVNNIYDLAGNGEEFTQEVLDYDPNGIYVRGGPIGHASGVYGAAAKMEFGMPPISEGGFDSYLNSTSQNYSSRLQLYIK